MKPDPKPMKLDRTILKNPFVLAGILALGYWIVTYHGQQALELLPYSIFLLCPLMHVFMHRGHKHGDNSAGYHSSSGESRQPGQQSDSE